MVALLGVAGLVLDGGLGYNNRRQMQNAADSAALAGAGALQQARFAGAAPSGILTAVTVAAERNGSDTSDPSHFRCGLLTLSQSRTRPLPDMSTLTPCSAATTATVATSVGVFVETGETHSTLLASAGGNKSLTTRASAAASVQQAMWSAGPWAVCGNAALGGYDLLTSDGRLRPEAELRAEYGGPAEAPVMGGSRLADPDGGGGLPRSFPVHGKLDEGAPAGVDPWCGGLSANWKGLIDKDFLPVATDTNIDLENGKKVGQYHFKDTLAGEGGCPESVQNINLGSDDFAASFDDCLVTLPIFDQVLDDDSVHVAAIATFRLFYTPSASVKYYGQFVCGCAIASGETSDVITPGGLHAIRLIL